MKTGPDYDELESIKEKLSSKYPTLTKSDLIWRHGTRVEWLRMIATKLGKTSRELQKEIDLV